MSKHFLSLFLCLIMLTSFTACERQTVYETQIFAMSTLVSQTTYGKNAEAAARELNSALADFEEQFSMFSENGDIARINASAGQGGVDVSPETADFLRRALELSKGNEDYFAITIAPLSLLWGIASDEPKVPADEDVKSRLLLVDDSAVIIEGNHVTLPVEGMAIDLGGIAKGEACRLAKEIYEKYNLAGAWLSIGGNVYAYGEKPNGKPFKIGFRDPKGRENSVIAAFNMKDTTMAVSGGYERFFEVDGKRYIHILDPRTGYPAESDIVEVGVMHTDGATADFYSTTLFVGGLGMALDYMANGGTAIVLDNEKNLYVSKSLGEGFELSGTAVGYVVKYI